MTSSKFAAFQAVIVPIGAGLIVASHIGKIPASLPAVRSDLSLSLTQAAMIVSSFSVIAALFGIVFGVISARLGMFRAGILGLFAAALGALIGTRCDSFLPLLGARVIEGGGFFLVAVTMPGLINVVCPPAYRALALGVWGAFIPAAMTLMLIISPTVLDSSGWTGLWLLTGAATLVWMVVFSLTYRRVTLPSGGVGSTAATTKSLLTQRPVMVVLTFVCYSALFAATTAFIPTFWSAAPATTLDYAALLAAVVVTGNIAGNITSGYLVGRGASMGRLLTWGLALGGSCAILIFAFDLPLWLRFSGGILFTFFAGFVPGATFASLPSIVGQTTAIPLMVGMIFQGAGIGQVLGPLLVGLAVELSSSWNGAALVLALLAMLGVGFSRFTWQPSGDHLKTE